MLAKERLVYIVNCLQIRPSMSIQELSKEMNVSFSTVQRDLRRLEQDKKIERSRGGALSPHVSQMLSGKDEVSVDEKIHLHESEKEIIAKHAAKYINDGDCIFLDSGTTIAHIVPYIMNKQVTIVTNSIYLQKKLIRCRGEVYLLGGFYHPKYDMTLGAPTLLQLDNLHFSTAFLSASGVDLKNKELYSVEADIALIKKMVIKRAKKTYVLADHSKFDIEATHTYAKLSEINCVFTDQFPQHAKQHKSIILCK